MAETKPLKSHRHGRLREAVIEHAIDAARACTVEDLSMRDVSRRLGVSSAAIYRHFPDRDAILRAVAKAGFDMLAERFEAAVPFASKPRDAEDAVERFVTLGMAYVAFAHDHYGLWRLMFGPYGRGSESAGDTRPSTYTWLGKVLEELHAYSLIETATAEDRYFAWTAIHGFSDLQASPATGDGPFDATVRAQCLRVLRGLGFDRSAAAITPNDPQTAGLRP